MNRLGLILLLFPWFVKAQTVTPLIPVQGLVFSPDYSFRHLTNSNSPLGALYEKIESPGFGYTAGYMSATPLHGFMKLEGGLMFANKAFRAKPFSEETMGVIYTDNLGRTLEKRSYAYNHYFIDAPFKINFYITKSKLKFYATTGINLSYYLKSKFTQTYFFTNGTSEHYESKVKYNYRRFYVGALAGIGLELDLGPKAYLKFEPILRYTLRSLTDEAVKSRLYSIGINCGIFYNL